MIVVINTSDLYVIAHFPRQQLSRYMCSFRKELFSEKALQHIRLLLPDNGRSVYQLNDQQDRDVNNILQKIQEEKGSDYRFTAALQRTYIIELIHFITKVHQQSFPFVHSSAN